MDEIDYGIREVLKHGGSKMVSIPMPAFKQMNMPKSFRWEIGKDRIARLIPIYGLAVLPFFVAVALSGTLIRLTLS